ncbi:MAG: sugar phosphate isomerase/epimerase [candidate division WOR-3 bacterium]
MHSTGELTERLGIQILFDFSDVIDCVEFAASQGFRALELNLGNIEFGRRLRRRRERQRLLETCRQLGVSLAFHALEGLSFFIPSVRARRAAVAELKQVLDWADETGAVNVVMHLGFDMHYGLGGTNRYTHEQFPEYSEQSIGEALAELKEYADGRSRLCVENVGGFRFRPAQVALRRLLGGALGLCLDTGHLHILPPEKREAEFSFFSEHRMCIYHVHMHDNNGIRDEHLAMGDGKIDFLPILRMLVGIDALLVFETRPKEQALRGRDYFLRVIAPKLRRAVARRTGQQVRARCVSL